MNLTGIEEEREVYIKHFLDSISAVTNNYINENTSLIDVIQGQVWHHLKFVWKT